MTMRNIIECKNLTHYYGDRLIYKNLCFDVQEGKVMGLLGKNGTGKTTTINIINGYLKPTGGYCRIFGEDITVINPKKRENIGLLIEGHEQYSFMNIMQLEKFYSKFYPKWDSSVYFELVNKLRISPKQKLKDMSCGQRSQVVLGLVLSQNADLLILDDFSMGLDPGYRRLFIDYLKEYIKSERKTVFVTSHIIQDLERLIDDCIIMDYGKILVQKPIKELLNIFYKYSFYGDYDIKKYDCDKSIFYSSDTINNRTEIYSYKKIDAVKNHLDELGIMADNLVQEKMDLEEIFIGLTGKY